MQGHSSWHAKESRKSRLTDMLARKAGQLRC